MNKNILKHPGILFKRMLHPVLMTGLKSFEKLEYKEDNSLDYEGYEGPVLYAFNHSNVHDFPMVCKVLKKHVYVLVANDINNGFINDLMLSLNGVIFVKRNDKESTKKAKEKIINLLNSGQSVVMFPEASWNLDDVNLIHDFKWGIIDIAKKTGVPIIPVAMKYNVEEKVRISYGKPIHVGKDDDLFTKKEELHEKMSTLIWDIITSGKMLPRSDYEKVEKNYQDYVDKCLNEFGYNPEYERQFIFGKQPYPFEIVGPTYDENIEKVHAKKRIKKR